MMRTLRRRIALLLCGWLLTPPAFGADTPSSPGDLEAARAQHLARAQEAIEGEEWSTALEQLKAALGAVPNHPSYLQAITTIGIENGDKEAVLFGLRHLTLAGLGWPSDLPLGAIVEDDAVKRALINASANRVPKGEAETWYTFPSPQYNVEGIAPLGNGEEFVAGELSQPVLYRGNPENGLEEWVEFAEADALGVFGIRAEAGGDTLLVCLSPALGGEAASLVVRLDAASGQVTDRRACPAALGATMLGDAVAGSGETVFASDSIGHRLLVSRSEGADFEVLGTADWSSPQGLVWDERRGCLFVADYTLGVFRCDPATGEARRLAAPPTSCLAGIDGLYLYRGKLVAVQNATLPQRIVWLSLDREGTEIESVLPLLSGDRRLSDPTLGFIRDDAFFVVARSPWPFLEGDHFARPAEECTLLLKLPLFPRP